MDLKRLSVKYIRDFAKSAYVKDVKCFICDSEENLQLHHFCSITPLWGVWLRKNKIRIRSEQDVLDNRSAFVEQHKDEIYKDTVTLCKSCHMDKLHKVFGKCPPIQTAKAQAKWCQKMKTRASNKLFEK